jgi:hypothetical protein
MAFSKTKVVHKFTRLLAARGYNPTQILIILQIADHEHEEDGTPCSYSNATLATEIGLKDKGTITKTCARAKDEGFIDERSGGRNGAVLRSINIEGFTRHEEELDALRDEYKRTRQAAEPTREELRTLDWIGEHLRYQGHICAEFSDAQIKRIKTHIFRHLHVKLRKFEQKEEGLWIIRRHGGPSLDQLPGVQRRTDDFVQKQFERLKGQKKDREVRHPGLFSDQFRGAEALYQWHWPDHDLHFQFTESWDDEDTSTLRFDVPLVAPRRRDDIPLPPWEVRKLEAAKKKAAPPEPEPVIRPPAATPQLAPKDDPSLDVPLGQYIPGEAPFDEADDRAQEYAAVSSSNRLN